MSNYDTEELFSMLQSVDPAIHQQLKPNDSYRITQALMTYKATGKNTTYWRQHIKPTIFFPKESFQIYAITPNRETLYNQINSRFIEMIESGVVEEIRQVLNSVKDIENYHAYKTCGIPEIAAYIKKELPLDTAISKAQQHTRNYAKRQLTWIKTQMNNMCHTYDNIDEITADIDRYVSDILL